MDPDADWIVGVLQSAFWGVSGLCVSNVTTAPPSLRDLHVCGFFPHAFSSLIPHILNIWELNAFCIHTVREYSQTHFLCIIDSVSAWLTPPSPTASRAPWSQTLRALVLLRMWWKLPGALTDRAAVHPPWPTRRTRGEGRVSTPSLRCPGQWLLLPYSTFFLCLFSFFFAPFSSSHEMCIQTCREKPLMTQNSNKCLIFFFLWRKKQFNFEPKIW